MIHIDNFRARVLLAALAVVSGVAPAGAQERSAAHDPVREVEADSLRVAPIGGYRFLGGDRAEIPFDVYHGDIRMRAQINGRPVHLLIDNGTLWDDLLLFGSAEVDALDLDYGEATAIGGSGEGAPVQSRMASGVTVRFPGVEFVGQTAAVTSYVPGALNLWAGTEGQVSSAFFKNFVVEVDFDRMLVILTEPEPTHAPGVGDGQGVELPMTQMESGMWGVVGSVRQVGGQPAEVMFALDLGNSNPLQVVEGGAYGLRAPAGSVQASLGFGLQGEVLGRFGAIPTVTLGGFEVPDVLTAFEEGNEWEEVMVGFDILSRFNLVFDYPHGRLGITPNSHFEDSFVIGVGGVYMRDSPEGGTEVTRVSGRSPLAEVVRFGDRIIELDGEAVTDWDVYQVVAGLEERGGLVQLTLVRGGERIEAGLEVRSARFVVDDEKYGRE